MKDLLEYIIKNLVTNPDTVAIEEENQDGNVNLYLTVDTKDMGLVIGKGGQTIHAIRKILTVRAIAENVRVNLQLNEPETPVITSEVEPEVKSDADTSDVNEEDPNKIASSDKPS
ncbi:MAG: hypothetical protein G01um101493_242 [Microgenomates group bacterium Gr01-1014_93]|nr:MAG: hypothetical protein G01um101493_242 [Microgenomates group bacterium Gr01-1014_93]